jgi:hypothetical protein
MGYFPSVLETELPGAQTVYTAAGGSSQVQLNTSTETVIATLPFTIDPTQTRAGVVVAFDAPFLYRPTDLTDSGRIELSLYLDNVFVTKHFLGTSPSNASPTPAAPCTLFGAMSLPANIGPLAAGSHIVEARAILVASVGNPDAFYNGDINPAALSIVIAET